MTKYNETVGQRDGGVQEMVQSSQVVEVAGCYESR